MSNLLDCLAHYHFGEGKVAVHIASVGNIPALVLTHAKMGGKPGEIAHPQEPSAEDPEVLRQSVVLTFATEAMRDAVESALGAK